LRVESVAWITERKDVLCGLFFILTLLTYIYYCETNKRKWYWHSLGFSLLALLSKPIAVVIPPVLLLLDYYPLKRLGGDVKFWGKEARKKYYEKVPFAVLSLAVSVFTFSANYHLVGSTLASTTSLSIGDRFLVMSYGPRFYIEKLFLPLNLSPLYELWGKIEVLRGRYIIEYLVALIMVILILSMRKRFPAIYYSSLFFLITLFPVSGIMQAGHQIVADRFTYIPSMGLSLILGGFMASILSSDYYKIIYIKKATLVMAVVVLVILVGLTRKQEKLWINSKTLWEHAIFVSPDSSYAHFQVGEEWYQEGRVNEAMEHYKIAFSLSPHRKEAYLNIANRFSKYNMFAEAEWLYKSLIQTYPSFEFAWLSLGGTYFNAGYPNKAIEIYEQALQIDPGFSLIKEDLEKVKNARNFLK
jgi:tetratricopeptide (TPR) repeat protein